jgi:hypothetical protein|tara:strand:+ start:97 stop:255 length:159 start_codon:yes stop_codon:yes gene_type:complete
MGRIADAMRANLDRIRELDQRQEELINKLLDTTQRLIDEANIEISKLDRFDD